MQIELEMNFFYIDTNDNGNIYDITADISNGNDNDYTRDNDDNENNVNVWTRIGNWKYK